MASTGDLNHDGDVVGKADLALLRTLLEGNPSLIANLSDTERNRLDFTGDGTVGQEDLIALCEMIMHQGGDGIAAHHQEKLASLRAKLRK
jgi:hypothetical protein